MSSYALMQSQLSTELLLTILVSVNRFNVGVVNTDENWKWNQYRHIDFTHQNRFKIDGLVIKNAHKLEMASDEKEDQNLTNYGKIRVKLPKEMKLN